MISDRQRKILELLVQEYIDCAEPISSAFLQKQYFNDISPATIRNEFQDLTQQGYLMQPHTSAGRVPTNKGYKFFVEITFVPEQEQMPHFILKEIEEAKKKLTQELELAQALAKLLQAKLAALEMEKSRVENDMVFEVLRMLGPSRISYNRNIDIMRKLLNELEQF